jgi:hypothetical protein
MRTRQTQQVQSFPASIGGVMYLTRAWLDACSHTGKAASESALMSDVPLSPGRARRLYPYPSSNRRHRRR